MFSARPLPLVHQSCSPHTFIHVYVTHHRKPRPPKSFLYYLKALFPPQGPPRWSPEALPPTPLPGQASPAAFSSGACFSSTCLEPLGLEAGSESPLFLTVISRPFSFPLPAPSPSFGFHHSRPCPTSLLHLRPLCHHPALHLLQVSEHCHSFLKLLLQDFLVVSTSR